MTNKLVILDRDGVINQDSDEYIKSTDEWVPIPGSIEAISILNNKGYRVAIATNQSGISRGYFSLETLQAMHDKLRGLLSEYQATIDYIAFCPHEPKNHCECRKPKPGLLFEISRETGIPLNKNVVMVGDSIRDLEAGIKAGCSVALLLTGKGARSRIKASSHEDSAIRSVPVFQDLLTFAEQLKNESN